MNPADQATLDRAKKAHELHISRRGFFPRLWETSYSHDRRAHRHKCQCCGKIVNQGEQVVMYCLGTKTRVIHVVEADKKVFGDDGYTWRDLALTHAYPQGF